MKMFRKLASVFLSLSMLAAVPQVKAEEIPETMHDSEEIVLTEETSETTVSEETDPEKTDLEETDREETGEEVISETAEPEETVKEESDPGAPEQEAAGTEAPEEEKEEAESEPQGVAEEGSEAMEEGIVMPAEFVLPSGYDNPVPVTVTMPGKTTEDLVFTSTDGSVVWFSAEDGGQVIAHAGLTGTATVDAFIMEGDVSIASASMSVTVENWIDSSVDFMRFTEIDETQSLFVQTIGAAAGHDITLGPPPEEKGDPIFAVTPDAGSEYTVKALKKGRSEIWATVDNPNPEGLKDQKFEIKVTEVLVLSGASIPQKIIIDPWETIRLAPGRTEVVTLSFEPADADPLLIKCGVNPEEQGQEPVVSVERDPFYPYRYFITASDTLRGSSLVYFQYTDGDVPASQVRAIVDDPFVTLPEAMDIPYGERVRIPVESNLRELYDGGADWTISPDTGDIWISETEDNHFYVEAGRPLEEPVSVSLSVTLEDESVIQAGPMSVMAREWIDDGFSFNEVFLDGKASDASEVTIPYDGPDGCADFELVPPLEEKDNPLVEATRLRRTEEGVVFSIKPVREGHSVLFAEVKNPYSDSEPFHYMVGAVTVAAKGTKPKVIYLDCNEMEMEPDMNETLSFMLEPDSADPRTVSVKSSNPKLVTAVKSDADPYLIELKAENDMEGTADITVSAGTVKAICKVTVVRSIKADKDAMPLLMGEDKGSVTVALAGRGSGNAVKFQYLDAESWEPIDPETAPFAVEEVSHEGDTYRYSVTPKSVGNAVINFWYESETAFSETFTYVEVREMEQIEWRDDLIKELQERVFRNKEEVYLDAWGAVDPTIRYSITYYTNKEDAEADQTDPELLYQNHFYIDSNFLGTTYAKLRAVAEKPGFRPSEILDAVLTVDNGDMGIWDPEHLDYINAAGGLYMVHNKLCVYGVPDAENGDEWEKQQVTYTGQPITFNDSLRVWFGTRYLEEGTDYKVSYSNNKMPALSSDKKAPSVTITGMGDFKDKKTIFFTILKRNVSDCPEYDIAGAFLSYPESERSRTLLINNKSKPQTPKITLSLMRRIDGKSVKLAQNKDYTLLYYPYTVDEHGINPGIPVTQITKEGRYIIAAKAADGSTSLIGDPEHMPPGGKQDYLLHMPRVDVFNTDQDTVADIAKAKLSKNLGTVTLNLNAEGYYDPEDIYQKFYGADPEIKVTIGKRQLIALEKNNENNRPDFEVFLAQIKAGDNLLELFGLENFEKEEPAVVGTKYVKFTIAPILKMSSSTAKIEGLKKTVILNSYDRFLLWKEGEIHPSSIAEGNDWNNVKLKDKAGNVIPSDYYDVHVSDYRKGTGTITVTFTGRPERGYTGSVSQKIEIEKASLTDLEKEENVRIEFTRLDQENAEAVIPQAEFAQAGTKPEYRVIYRSAEGWERDLTEGVDFTVSWSDNKKLSSVSKKNAKLTIKGKGYFTGSAYREFAVVEADFDHMYWLNQLTVSCPDVVYNAKGKPGYFRLAPTVYDGTKKLTAGKDYRVIENGQLRYAENFVDETGKVVHVKDEPIFDTDDVPVGARIASDQRIEVLNSSYTYSRPEEERWIHAEYRIVTKDMNISSATVVVNGKQPVCLGEDWSVVPPIEVSLKEVPLKPENYVIESITNNWKVGTATMVIRGVGKYCGTKKVTFKIDKSSLMNKEN